MTNDLVRRIAEHKSKSIPGFSKQYNLTKLVYSQSFPSPIAAITAEKKIKKWPRRRKIRLIREQNPYWDDLAEEDPAVSTAG